jgi:signal transduction histidine kinase
MAEPRSTITTFKPRARLLVLLGDQLIRDSGIAVFELIKNAYDADATEAVVTLHDIESADSASIVTQDDGCGMHWDTVTNVWLEPGTDHRLEQRERVVRTPKYHRLPLGEKGVGRFAAHKLGDHVLLITRSKGQPEVLVEIKWKEFCEHRYLSDAKVAVKEREPEVFTGKKTGTRIEVRQLRDSWSRDEVRRLHRAVMSICSPFEQPSDFHTKIVLEPDNGWLEGLLTVSEVLEQAIFRANCTIRRNKAAYVYSFNPPQGMDRVGSRSANKTVDLPVDLGIVGVGPVRMDLHIFDLDSNILQFTVSDRRGFRQFLNSNGGIRVYRDGIRVYDYGELGNDWLDLGGRRVNVPAKRISNNLVIGAVSLSRKESEGLVEKTNREGFVENESYRKFQKAILSVLIHIETERQMDKLRIRKAYSGKQKEPVTEEIGILREELKQRGLLDELGHHLDTIEQQYREVTERLLTAAGAGLTLATVIHEIEKGIAELRRAVNRGAPEDRIRQLAEHLNELVDGLTYLTRKSGKSKEKASVLIRQALFNTEYRLRHHKIQVENGLEKGDSDFSVTCTRRLIIATLMNLIDNAIWWLENKGGADRRIYIGTRKRLAGHPAIVVADNGPGFIDPPEFLTQPFISRKPDGMGLGLHVASEIMKAHGGKLLFPQTEDVGLPDGIGGAVVALAFGETS